MNKKEPQGMIELHLGGCKQNNQTLEVPNELYTEWKDWASNRFNNGYQSGFLEGTTPTYEAYMQLKKSIAASLK